MSDNDNPIYPQLRLQSLRWKLGGEAVVPFTPGLVILHGRTQSIRTVFLRLIRYGLGGNAERIDSNTLETIVEIELKLLANSEAITIVRSCEKPSGKIKVIDTQYERELTPRELTEYLLDKLDMPKVFMTNIRQGKSIDVLLSFNDISRALFVDRDISYPAILSEVLPTPRKEITKVMMGLTTREVAQAENVRRTLQMRQQQLRQELAGIRQFLTNLNVPDIGDIQQRRQTITQALSEVTLQENAIRERIERGIQSEPTDNGSYTRLRSELLDKRSQIEQHQQEIRNIEIQHQEKVDLRVELETEVRRINRHLASQHVISSYTFSQCPRCLQAIEPAMYNREVDGDCMLCGRPFSTHIQDVGPWEKARRDVEQLINEAGQLLNFYEERRSALQRSVAELSGRVQWLEHELQRETTNYVSPLIEEIRLRASERAEMEKGLEQLRYQEIQRQYANRYEEDVIPKVEQELEDIGAKLTSLQEALGSESLRYNAFLTHFRHFMRNVDLVSKSSIYGIAWDEQELLPTINEQSYKKAVSGPDLAITVLAFHYALLAMSVSEPSVFTNHPKFLVIDEPEQQKMGKERYGQVLKLFSELAIEYRGQVQIIIATDTRDITPELEPYAYEI